MGEQESQYGIGQERVEQWKSLSSKLGFTDFVTPEDNFASCEMGNWLNAEATGMYSFLADDGEVYIGQSVRARGRLRAHYRGIHRDMIAASFMKLQRNELDEKERSLIHEFGHAFPTRNIKHALRTAAHVAFDKVVPISGSDAFVSSSRIRKYQVWRDLKLLEQKQIRKFAWLKQSEFYDRSLDLVRIFISNCIPMPDRTEGRFWSLSVLLGNGHFIRINAGQQEVFTVLTNRRRLFARVLSRHDMLDGYGAGPYYQTKSYDYEIPAEEFPRWLTLTRATACRELVVWLMRHTTSLNNGSHCPQVVRRAFVR